MSEEKDVESVAVDFSVGHNDTHVVAAVIINGEVEYTLAWTPEDARDTAANLTKHSIQVEMKQ